jgi:hypothetical protein
MVAAGGKGCVAIGAECLDVIQISIPNIFVNYTVKLKFINLRNSFKVTATILSALCLYVGT